MSNHPDQRFTRSNELLDELRGRNADDFQETDEEYLVRTHHRSPVARPDLATGGHRSMPPAMTTNQRRLWLLVIVSLALLLLSLIYSSGTEAIRF